MTDIQYLETLLKPLLDEPERLLVVRTTDDMGVLLSVSCGRNDMGRIIGKDGATAKAIRTILRVLGSRESARLHMKLLEPQESPIRKNDTLRDTLEGITSSPISA